MRKKTAFVVAFLAMAAVAARAQEGEQPPIPSLFVQGTGQASAPPDEATVRLGVVAQDPTARAAQDKANRAAAAILAGVRELGVEAKDVQTSQLTLFPLYSQNQPRPGAGEIEQQPRIVGYQASYVVSVRLEKLDLVGRAIDAGLAAGANQVEGVSFGLRNDQAARDQALQMAVREARRKAQTIAAALEVRLGEVLEVSEGAFSIVQPRFDKRMALETAAAAPTPVEAGQITVDAAVTVRYRIGQ